MSQTREVNIIALGFKDSPHFEDLKRLPAGANVVAVGLADELLGE